MKVTRVERGWAGHFICASRCRFRRNTLLTSKQTSVVVSTVGLMETIWNKEYYSGPFQPIGAFRRYYETMAFYSNPDDSRYHDADVTREISFDSPWSINEVDADDRANTMHEKVVEEIKAKMEEGQL